MKDRIKRIFSNTKGKVDAFLVANKELPNIDPNFFYVSKTKSGSFEGCYAVAKRNGKSYLLTSELEEPIARKETKLEIVVFKNKEERENRLKEILSDVNNLGINSDGLSCKQYSDISKITKAKLTDISDAFQKTKSIKDKNEIKQISKACKISSQVANNVKDFVKQGMSEKQLSNKINTALLENGATSFAFDTIVASGENSSQPHHSPTDKKLGRNEFILVDFGATFNRYASDISRTFVLGKADAKMREIHKTVLDVQLRALDMIKEGVNGRDVYNFVKNEIDKKYKGRFIHSLGHEVGLSVHDGKRLTSEDFMLKENMVVTIEPEIYVPSIGGVRIEDTVLVTKGKSKVLTSSPKELMEL